MKQHFSRFTIVLLTALACGPRQSSDTQTAQKMKAQVEKSFYGTTANGQSVDLYQLTNVQGMKVEVVTYGGIITSMWVPDREGQLADITLGFGELSSYEKQSPYFGAIIGRYGNRIAKGAFTVEGEDYQLATNNIGNHLHGGIVGFDKVVWDAEPLEEEGQVGVRFTYTSADGEEGYPGNLKCTVVYMLNNENQLTFDYTATTDRATVVNLTNHAYYNLSAMEEDILGHELTLYAANYLPVDETLIPTQIASVEGTPFDFLTPKTIGRDIDADHPQIGNGGGYDHCWIIDGEEGALSKAATVYHAASGRVMEIFTTEPGVQFYSGNFLDGSIMGKDNKVYGRRSALCLETEHFPDSPNRPDFPSTVLAPGETYRSTTVTRFSVK